MPEPKWFGKKGLQYRDYKSYQDYLEHQKSKLDKVVEWHAEHGSDFDGDYSELLLARLKESDIADVIRGKNVLCLAARLGGEVRAFTALSCFAVGIDLNPGQDNRYVLHGDFHNLQFAPDTVDAVFTNSLDHVFDMDKLFTEINRVMRTRGLFITEVINVAQAGPYESMWWDSMEILEDRIKAYGYDMVLKGTFDKPWQGIHLGFQKCT
ncbi:MAG: class I SAM-dependent methyltransferase [Candidatus Thorarchaeota archaeon]|jgi:SAM-dependent methyltransferase